MTSVIVFFLYAICTATQSTLEPCLTDVIKSNYNPSDRGDLQSIRFPPLGWPSARLAHHINYYLLSEVMGYRMTENSALPTRIGTISAWNSLGGDEIDLAVEMGDAYPDMSLRYLILANNVRDFGSLGYSAHPGLFIPNYALVLDPSYEYLISLNSTTAQAIFATNITHYIESKENLTISSIPDSDFEPDWCVNSPCIEMLLPFRTWYVNHYQSVVMNLRLNIRISWWGYGRMIAVASSLLADNVPFIFGLYTPDGFIATSPLSRMTIKVPTGKCFAGANTSNTIGISSIDCDYAPTRLFKAGRTSFWTKEAASDGREFLSRLTIAESEIESMLQTVFAGENERDVACDWLNANEDVWSPWIRNTYVPPGKKLDAKMVIFYIGTGFLTILGLVWLLYYTGIIRLAEEALFDMALLYCGKIVSNTCDILSDVFIFFTEINGNANTQDLQVPFAICLGTSFIVYFICQYWNVQNAYLAMNAKGEDEEMEQEKQLEYRKSLWEGQHKGVNDFDNVEDVKLWTDAEIDFITTRINDCYNEILMVLFEDFPMCVLKAILIVSVGIVNTQVIGSFAVSCIAVGVRVSEFYNILMYKKQLEFIERQIENAKEFKKQKEQIEKAKASLFLKNGKHSIFGSNQKRHLKVEIASNGEKYKF